ncbi:TPR repeat protein [Natronocella acetinitrilica]|uniref:TPR repeat protein n=1 Tax=Natronocella acetinitrilica TaxID=414046 RepID=A0AAE3KAM9_9GAMM|nr:tetratricopeptide repeat protein [Natronocella acetinitrilica]MCP1674540.1 TPR repeat protein [Natronocella acetinitrilica]
MKQGGWRWQHTVALAALALGAGLGSAAAQGSMGEAIERAEAGDVEAMVGVHRRMFRSAEGPGDVYTGLGWLARAYAAGYVQAESILSGGLWMPRERDDPRVRQEMGRSRDDPQALVAWLREAADEERAFAAYFLHYHYLPPRPGLRRLGAGASAPGDEEIASGLRLLERAAAAGERAALRRLGALYLEGEYVEMDAERGYGYWRESAALGSALCAWALGSRLLEEAQGADEAQEALGWLERAAEGNILPLRSRLILLDEIADLYMFADAPGLSIDNVRAAHWLRLAVEQGSGWGAFRLVALLKRGEDIGQDPAEMADLIAPFAEAPGAPLDLVREFATLHTDGIGVERDMPRGLALLREAAERGHRQAMHDLAHYYVRGEGVLQDFGEATRWLRRAAKAEDARAQYLLAQFYKLGAGVEQSLVMAHKWANLAAASEEDGAATLRDQLLIAMTPEEIAEAQARARAYLAGDDAEED